MTTYVFDAQVARHRRHTLSVFTVPGGWDISCSCHRWKREGWCEAEGGWRVWMSYVAEDIAAAGGPAMDREEYSASPFNFPPTWPPGGYLVGVIDLMPSYRRQCLEIEAMERDGR